jgi:hypothetical protein
MNEVRKIGQRSAGVQIEEAIASDFVEMKERPRHGRAEKIYKLANMSRPEDDRVRRATPQIVNMAGAVKRRRST